MPLVYKFSESTTQAQTAFTIVNTTGTYSSSNTGGAGAPNADLSSTTACTMQVFIPDPNTFEVSTSAITIDLFALGYPQTVSSIDITNVMLGLSSTALLPDGYYTLSGSLTTIDPDAGSLTSTYTIENIPLSAITQCCIDTKTASNCGCKKDLSIALLTANLQIASLPAACSAAEGAANLKAASEACAANKFCKNCS